MLKLNTTIDTNSGFCFGVVYAIQMAEDFLAENSYLYCLGDIVHNDEEVKRLTDKGLRIIDHDKLKTLHGEKVMIRAHGEPPETYRIALENDIELVDASCPVVLKLQNRVREAYDDDQPILIYGKHGHAEVKGLVGQTVGEATVVETFDELDEKELPKKLTLFSQTTKSSKKLYALRDELTSRGIEVDFKDTLCRQVSNRDLQLRDFVKGFDKIVFVSGLKSSNGKVLYEVCKEHNPNSYFISNQSELKPEMFEEGNSVGICGATSTPQWLMEEVKATLDNF
ncbi:MAG: 4-hydroxy-3-methylbut-2-enyl diphosphate reductase [Flavobacteriaceae bacterium]|nr:4-hydroxy-3-methylbut-2-enyl diphosphate reductase [Flavobacteriaceae bacterium]